MKIIFLNWVVWLNNSHSATRITTYHSVPVSGSKGMVTSDAPYCSELGANILKKGGNAMDAAVTTNFCQGLLYPFASGIGGGGYMLIYKKGKDPEFINFRETAPKLANETMFKNNPQASTVGGLSVAIPGEVKGLELAHKKYGKLPWRELIEPVVKLAMDGFEVPVLLTRRIQDNIKSINASQGLREVYLPNNEPIQNGTIFKNPTLGGTLIAIMEQGAKAFYEGPIAQHMVQVIRENGGIITEEDLKNYEPSVVSAVSGTFRGRKLFTIPPPGSGVVLISALNIFENFPSDLNYDPLKVHRITETMKHAYSFRLNLGDPKFVPAVAKVVEEAISKTEAAARFKKINDSITYAPEYYTKTGNRMADEGTSHVNVLDEDGLAVAVTSTVNTIFGSKVLDTVTGVIFNSEMDDFSTPDSANFFNLPPSESNFIRPGKVPQSTMSPIIVTDDEGNIQWMVGASGGSYIVSALFQVILGLIEDGLSPSDAVSMPRLHNQLIPNEIKYEPGFSDDILEGLKMRNHTIQFIDNLACVGVIARKMDQILGAADNRKLGIASGF